MKKMLDNYIKEYSERNKKGNCTAVYSVTNSQGFVPSTEYFSKEVYSKDLTTYKIVKYGMIAYNPSRINVGSVAVQRKKEEVVVSPLYVVVSVNEEELLPEFLCYFLHSNIGLAKIAAHTSGSVRDSLKYNALKKIDISIYPICQQRDIIKKLSRLEDLIAKKKLVLQKFNDLVKSQFIEMFGDPIVNTKGWQLMSWEAVLTIINGRNQKEVEQVDGDYPIYGSGGEMGRAHSFLCKENSIVIGRKGNINKPLFVRTKFWNVDTAFGLEVGKSLLPEYLYYFCLQYNFEQHNKTVTIPSLTKRDLLKILIPIPPIELQNEFARFVEQTDKSKFRIKQSLEKLEKCYKALLQKYFG